MPRKRLIVIIISAFVGILILIAWAPWASLRFHGDGKFKDGGFWDYPRYSLTFPDIRLDKAGEYTYRFRGLPEEEMTLMLFVKGRDVENWEDRAPLENLKVKIDISLTSLKGREGCHASGQPGPGSSDGMWVLTSGVISGYWHWQCNHVQVHSDGAYTLTIRVTDIDPNGEKVVVAPTLEGGGIELP